MSVFPRPLKKVLGKIIPFSKEDKIPTFNLGEGTADGTTYLRGDGSWTSVSGASVADGDKGDVTVSGSGTVWTVDNVAAANVTTDSTHRFITDAQLTNLGNQSGTNTGDNATNTTSNSYADGKVSDAIVDGVTTVAPSQNAVFDALAGKQASGNYFNKTSDDTDDITEGATNKFATASEKTKLGFMSVTQSVDLDTIESDTATNNAKVTNATHTGDVTGSGLLTIDPTAITGKTLVTAVGTDYALISDTSDSGNLKKCLVSDFAGGGGVSDGDKGDITVSSSGTVWNIDAATVGVTELSATGTANNTTYLRGDNTWATPTDPSGWTTIVKSANQDVTNNGTLQDDTDLQFSVVAGGHYMVEMNICYSANDSTGDYRGGITLSAGLMRGTGLANSVSTTYTYQASLLTANNSINTGFISLGGPASNIDHLIPLVIQFNFYVDSNATFKYQFCNSSAALGRTSRTWKGSIMKYKRID